MFSFQVERHQQLQKKLTRMNSSSLLQLSDSVAEFYQTAYIYVMIKSLVT
jgi:hypothetical protein